MFNNLILTIMVQQELEQSLNQLAEFLVEKIMEHVIDVQVSQKDDSTYYVEMTRDNSDVIEFKVEKEINKEIPRCL